MAPFTPKLNPAANRVIVPRAERLGDIYLGDKDFVRRSRPRCPGSREVPRRQREPLRWSLEALLRERSNDAVALAYREHAYSLREIAAQLGRTTPPSAPPPGGGASARSSLKVLRWKT
jgi:hypothetical protein